MALSSSKHSEPVSIKTRKGARSRADIPPQILHDLNLGVCETASLAESLAIDFTILMRATLQVSSLSPKELSCLSSNIPIMQRTLSAGEILLAHIGLAGFHNIASHRSDTVRGWAAYMLALAPAFSFRERIQHMRMLADDCHFGVREYAWLALRPHIITHLQESFEILTPWAFEPSENLRRFASESTRPRGVWCKHIEALKQQPELGLSLLEALRSDASKYVQDSVSNWLNDAAKTQPQWVRQLCKRWQIESPTAQTSRICTRALRSL